MPPPGPYGYGPGAPGNPPPTSTPPWMQPLPPGPVVPPPDRRRAWLVVAAVGAVAVLIIAALVGYRLAQPVEVASSSTSTAPTTSAAPSPTPSSSTPPTTAGAPGSSAPPGTSPPNAVGPSTDPQVDKTVADIEKFVEQERGLTFTTPVKATVLDDQAFVQKLLSTETDEDRKEIAKEGDTLKALGLIDPNLDFVDAMHSALSAGVIGFYDDETKLLYVRGNELGAYERTTLAHELTHALDDQHFNLDRKQYDDDKGEIGFGFSALTEGNARRVENAYKAQLSTADRRDYERSQSLIGNNGELANIPDVVQELLSAPYDLGEPLVEDILKRGGQPALDKAFDDPPTSSEQVIDPSKYAAREAPVKVDPPPADGTVENDGVVGELVTDLVLAQELGQRNALTAVTGWGGDWGVEYTNGNQRCMRIDYVMDTPKDLQELQSAFQQWARAGSGRTVDVPTAGKVRVTSCVPS